MCANSNKSSRAFVLGLDGVPWNLIKKWATAGELPHFARLFEDGAAGPLDSTRPATTAVAWPSIATGVWPDKHGIYGFQKIQSDYTQGTSTRNDITQPELWDLLSPAIVGNVPMTYPADEIDGQVITGMMTSETNEWFTHPSELASEISSQIPEYQIDIPWKQYSDDHDAFLSDLQSLVEMRRELMQMLMETTDWKLFFFVYTAPDRLQHLIWDEDILLNHYQHLDRILGEVMEYVSKLDGNLFVVSDHGLGPLSKTVHVNRVLEKEGYLVRRENSGIRGALSQLGIDKERVLALPQKFGIDETTLLEVLPDSLVDSVASQVPGDHALYDIDYENTVAFLHGAGNIYINDSERFSQGCVKPSNVPSIKRELQSTLSEITDPTTGQSVLSVLDGDELFPTDAGAPDLVVEGHAEYTVLPSMEANTFVESETREGCHTTEGIFLAWGPNIKPGARPTNATVVDVAPTVLETVAGPFPQNLDGRVLEGIFKSTPTQPRSVTVSSESTSHDVTSVDGTDTDTVEDRLRGLGYIE